MDDCSGVVATMSALRTEFCIIFFSHALAILFCRVGLGFLATYDDARVPRCDLCVVISGCLEESSVACLLKERCQIGVWTFVAVSDFQYIANYRAGINEPRSQSLRVLKEEEAAHIKILVNRAQKQRSKSLPLSSSCSRPDAWREHTNDEGVGSTAIV